MSPNTTNLNANIAPRHTPGYRPSPPRFGTQTRNTFSDQWLHTDRAYYYQPPRGFGMDLNGDGKFDSKNDGFLTFDFNRDGKNTDQEIQQSRNLLKAFSGDFDSNADGRTDINEFFQGYSNYFQARSMDLDRDGVLSNWELQRAGGNVVTRDKSRRPGSTGWKSHNLNHLPGGRRLDQLNPWNGSYTSSSNWWAFASTNVTQANA